MPGISWLLLSSVAVRIWIHILEMSVFMQNVVLKLSRDVGSMNGMHLLDGKRVETNRKISTS